MNSTSGLSAFTLVSVGVMSVRSAGILSSTTSFMPYFFMRWIIPARMSLENGSFSTTIATLMSPGFFLSAPACSAARSMTLAMYWSAVDSVAKIYL